MESHPIPQDVTNFQFKLIGEMTVKQFAYLAAGIILGWIFFSVDLSLLIKVPLGVFFVLSGTALSFLPIDGRPMDAMILYFIEALFAPNQYVFQKVGRPLFLALPKQKEKAVAKRHGLTPEQLQTLLSQIPKTTRNPLDEKEESFFHSLSLTPSTLPVMPQPAGLGAIPATHLSPVPSQKTEEQKKEVLEKTPAMPIASAALQSVSLTALQPLKPMPAPITDLPASVPPIQHSPIKETVQQYIPKTQQAKQQLAARPLTQPKAAQPLQKSMPLVRKNVGIPLTPDSPNVLVGIVKDPRGNILPNMLVEVQDKEGNPVRAFKTNALGQFASATALLNGVYEITAEDPEGKHSFDTTGLVAKGAIIPPLEIVSRDQREELRQALFSQA